MKLKPIRSKKDYELYLDWVDKKFDQKIKLKSPEGETLQVVLMLIKQYEDVQYPIPVPDPIEVIKLKMEEYKMKNKDLVGVIGSKGYVSALLRGKKPLTIELARIFHKTLGIPAEVFLHS